MESDGVLRMEAERRTLIESTWTHCIRCKVPYGTHGCAHRPLTADKLLRSIAEIAAEEERKQRVKNARHALRYRREARGEPELLSRFCGNVGFHSPHSWSDSGQDFRCHGV